MTAPPLRPCFTALACAWVSMEFLSLAILPLLMMDQPPGEAVVFLAGVMLASTAAWALVGGIILHRAWRAIQPHGGTVTPGLAVGLMAVPGFNLVWQFRAFVGFAREFNGISARLSLPVRPIPDRLLRSYAISNLAALPLMFVPGLAQVAGVAACVLGLLSVRAVVEGVAMLEAYESEGTGIDGAGLPLAA